MSAAVNLNIPNPESQEAAVVYARYSSHNQGEQSIEGQLEKARQYAAAKGYSVVHEYVDRAQSGRTDNRAEFQQMLKDTAKKRFQVIIVWKVDRFGRNREEIAINKVRCKKNGVRVEYVAENIPNTPEGVILESVLEGFAEYYSLQLSQNIRRGQRVSAEKCQFVGGTLPLGYTTDENKRYIIEPKEAATVRLIFALYEQGKTVTEIIAHLNGMGLRTRRKKPFTKNSLHRLLKNEKYLGIYTYRDYRVEGGIPQIIEAEQFWKVQEMLKVNKKAPAHKWSRADYILTGKLFCGKCGALMFGESGTGKSGNKYSYYICSNRKRFKSCDKKAVRQDAIEKAVLCEIQKLIQNDELIEYISENTYRYYLEQDTSLEELNRLKTELTDVETSISNIVKAVEAGMFNSALKSRMDELDVQKQDLLDAIAGQEFTQSFRLTKDHILYFLRQFRNMDTDDLDCQKRMINTFLNSVFVYDDKIVLIFNYSGENQAVSFFEVEAALGDEVFGCRVQSSTTAHTYEHPILWFSNVFAIIIKMPES